MESIQEKTAFLKSLATRYGVDENRISSLSKSVITAQVIIKGRSGNVNGEWLGL